jgi:phospholipid transport system transporter-binding protein
MAETISLEGSFTLQSLDRINAEVAGRLGQAADATINLALVTDVDSTAISQMLHWQRAAQVAKHKLRFVSLPASLISLAQLYGVEGFLAFE